MTNSLFMTSEQVLALLEAGKLVAPGCTHVHEIKDVQASGLGCKECLEMGDTWVNLRICMECGHVGCCDSSKNKHATAHFHATGHPIMQSFNPAQDWLWCFVDQDVIVIEPL